MFREETVRIQILGFLENQLTPMILKIIINETFSIFEVKLILLAYELLEFII